jgi:hypothetical protein
MIDVGLSSFSILVVIGVIGLIVFLIYRSYSTRNKDTRPKTQPKGQPTQRPISVPTPRTDLSGSVFISYRRDDSADITGRIYDRLIQHFSRDTVFKT